MSRIAASSDSGSESEPFHKAMRRGLQWRDQTQLKLSGKGRFWMAMALMITFCGPVRGTADPIPVEIWRRGDDVLTLDFQAALEDAFTSSPDFKLSNEGSPGTMVVTIPDHVQWRRRLWKTKLIYAVEFTTKSDERIGLSKGSCWHSSVSKCASRVLQDAKTAAKKRPH
jgi:hypothetical protein